MENKSSEDDMPKTKRQRFNQRPGREAVVRIPVEGLRNPIEVAVVDLDPRSGTVELEIPMAAKIGHRLRTAESLD